MQSLLALQLPSAGHSSFLLPPREPVGPAEFCAQGLRRSFQNQCFFWLWSPAGSQAIVRVVSRLQLVADPLLWVCARGQPATDPVACSPRSFLSVLPGGWALIRAPTYRGFRCGPQATDWGMHPLEHFGTGAQAAGPLIRARSHPGFQVWAPRRSPARLQVRARAAFPSSQSRAEGGEVPEAKAAAAAAESSLTSNYVPLFSFPF